MFSPLIWTKDSPFKDQVRQARKSNLEPQLLEAGMDMYLMVFVILVFP